MVNSVFSGAANAFLTLRVGIIAKRYCASLVLAERWAIRRAATVEAARMPGGDGFQQRHPGFPFDTFEGPEERRLRYECTEASVNFS